MSFIRELQLREKVFVSKSVSIIRLFVTLITFIQLGFDFIPIKAILKDINIV